MSYSGIMFMVLMFLNLCITGIYLFLNYIRNDEKKISILLKAGVMLTCPLIGPAFIFMAYFLYKFVMSKNLDLEDVVFSKERVETFMKPDEDVERNMVSLEEALAVTDRKNLRTLMMNVIRGDYRSSLYSISLALNSEDSETAHYAASVLQEVLNDFRGTVQRKYIQCQQEGEEQEENCMDLIEYMNPILEQKVFTELEQRSMVEKMDETGEFAFQLNREKISSSCYEKIILRLLDIGGYERCRIWCQRAYEQYPQVLASYTCRLKFYFSCGERENFFHVMDELRQSDIMIDNETLELIRTFM